MKPAGQSSTEIKIDLIQIRVFYWSVHQALTEETKELFSVHQLWKMWSKRFPPPSTPFFDVVATQPLRNPTTQRRNQGASRRASRAVSTGASVAVTGPACAALSPTAPLTQTVARSLRASPPGPSHSMPQGRSKTSLYGRKTSWPMWKRYIGEKESAPPPHVVIVTMKVWKCDAPQSLSHFELAAM